MKKAGQIKKLLVKITSGIVLVLAVFLFIVPTQAQVKADKPITKECHNPKLGATGFAPFRVWYCPNDKGAEKLVDSYKSLIDGLWAEETQLEPSGMGEPKLNDEGYIDVYIINPNACVKVSTEPNAPCGNLSTNDAAVDADGATYPVEPYTYDSTGQIELTSSSTVFFNEYTQNPAPVIAHELFHVLEFSHSRPASQSWLGEASALWAMHVFTPGQGTYAHFISDFLSSPSTSLDDSNTAHQYGAATWLLWLEQLYSGKSGGPAGQSKIFELWQDMEGIRSPDDVDEVINSQVPWNENFQSFALENLNNKDFEPTIPYVYDESDPLIPETKNQHFTNDLFDLITDNTLNQNVSINYLAAQYDSIFQVDSEVKHISFDFSALAPKNALDVTVLGNVDGEWKRFDPDANGIVQLCRDDDTQNVSKMIVVLDNHNYTSTIPITGTYTLEAKSNCGVSGTLTWSSEDISTIDRDGAVLGEAKNNGTVIVHMKNQNSTTWIDDGTSFYKNFTYLTQIHNYDHYPFACASDGELVQQDEASGTGIWSQLATPNLIFKMTQLDNNSVKLQIDGVEFPGEALRSADHRDDSTICQGITSTTFDTTYSPAFIGSGGQLNIAMGKILRDQNQNIIGYDFGNTASTSASFIEPGNNRYPFTEKTTYTISGILKN